MQRRPAGSAVAGFTLIEILVVLAIVAIMVVAVALSVDAGEGTRRLETEAQRLTALIELACDESAQFGQDIGVRFESGGYRFVRAAGREWEPRTSDTLRARRLPDGMRLELAMGDRNIELDAASSAAAFESRHDHGSTDGGEEDSSDAFTPHLACDAEGVLNGDPRIGFAAGELRATLARDKDGSLRLLAGPEPR